MEGVLLATYETMETRENECERRQRNEEEEESGKGQVYTLLDAAGGCQSLDPSTMSGLCQMVLIRSTAQPLVTGQC